MAAGVSSPGGTRRRSSWQSAHARAHAHPRFTECACDSLLPTVCFCHSYCAHMFCLLTGFMAAMELPWVVSSRMRDRLKSCSGGFKTV